MAKPPASVVFKLISERASLFGWYRHHSRTQLRTFATFSCPLRDDLKELYKFPIRRGKVFSLYELSVTNSPSTLVFSPWRCALRGIARDHRCGSVVPGAAHFGRADLRSRSEWTGMREHAQAFSRVGGAMPTRP